VTIADQSLEIARDALRRHSWEEATEAFGQVAESQPLSPSDLESLAEATWWAGRPDESIDALERAYTGYVSAGDPARGAEVAILLMEHALRRTAGSVAAGWRAKAERLLDGLPESPSHARLKMFELITTLMSGDVDGALTLAEEAIDVARRVGDLSSETMSHVFKGRALVSRGDWQEGIRLIDEAAATALSGSLDFRTANNVYCCTIEACRSVGDFRRAGEWTEEADRWMERNSVSAYAGVCQIRRAELKRLRGDWSTAADEVRKACEQLERYRLIDEVGQGEVQVGWIRLQMGDYDEAESVFARAFEHGADPQPGLSLLMAARGNGGDAFNALRRNLGEDTDRPSRALKLPVFVHLAVASGETATAEEAVAELEDIAGEFGRPVFEAFAEMAKGELELGEGRADSAIAPLQRALALWRDLDFPFEGAATRTLLGRARLALGDELGARMDLEAARSAFERLGAGPALAEASRMIESIDRRKADKDRVAKAFVFTDIVTSTDLIGVIGDEAWSSLIAWHDRELRSVFAAHGGVEVSHAGDGFFVAFDAARAAIEAAVAIQRRLSDHRREHGFAPAVRIGVHVGEATVDDGVFRGQEVHLAARVSAAAQGDQVLISAAAKTAAGSIDYPVSEGAPHELKGIPGEVTLHVVDWR
jgi:class 3 adenylate cyclase/uncharacterized protein HemY